MIFTTITESEFRKFANQSPYKSFMQTPEIAKLREKSGWTVYYFAVKESDQILAATMAVAKPTFLGKSTFYTPGGPLVDHENTASKYLVFLLPYSFWNRQLPVLPETVSYSLPLLSSYETNR